MKKKPRRAGAFSAKGEMLIGSIRPRTVAGSFMFGEHLVAWRPLKLERPSALTGWGRFFVEIWQSSYSFDVGTVSYIHDWKECFTVSPPGSAVGDKDSVLSPVSPQ